MERVLGQSVRQTVNYVWSMDDILGQGATGFVYKGRHKTTGEEFAVKVFHSFNYMAQPLEVRSREFEVLKKVSHRNVVRLYAVEEELTSKNRVIVMELCTAGSLFDMLNDPENMYGLPEDDFKIVLRDIAAGMKHLREKGIVHRDLKPGNIMRTWEADGTPVYKLTDFGAAKELDANEQFMSLYGTEEYLHPDMYERAVLRKPAGKTFTATVDLWSMGVTLYHVATGHLPFRPYGGPRKNREIMHKITTEKPEGVISGLQRSENGPIDWSRDLPKTCRLSVGFKAHFIPILAGIMESDPHKIWGFDQYFAGVNGLLNRRAIDIFSVPSGALHKVYIQEEDTYASFQELIAEQTDIRSSRQLLYFDGDVLDIERFQPAKEYPQTTRNKPIILLSTIMTDFQSIHIPHTCKPPRPRQHMTTTLEMDASFAKVCSSTLFDIRESVDYLVLVETLIRLGVKWLVSYLRSWVSKIQVLASEVRSKINFLKHSLEAFEEHYNRETVLLNIICRTSSAPPKVNELKLFFSRITDRSRQLRQLKTEYESVSEELRRLEQSIVHDNIPLRVFIDRGSQGSDRLAERMDVIANKSRDLYRAFKKLKNLKRLSTHEGRTHRFDQLQFTALCDTAAKLFTEKSVPSCKRMHKESNAWFSNMREVQSQLASVESRFARLQERCEAEDERRLQLQKVYRKKLNAVESSFDAKPRFSDMKPASWPAVKQQLDGSKSGSTSVKSSFIEIRATMDNNTAILRQLSDLIFSDDRIDHRMEEN